MALSKLIRDLVTKANAADRSLDELAVGIVEGEKVDDAVIEQTCMLTGVPLKSFANRLEVLEQRRAAWNAANDRDWAAERKAVGAEARTTREAAKSVTAEIAALQAESCRLGDVENQLSGKLSRLQAEEREARHECELLLRKSGSPDDWRAVGAPQRRKSRLQELEEAAQRGEDVRIDIGSGQHAA